MMHTQFFGNYLINKCAITSQQLLHALEAHSAKDGFRDSFMGDSKIGDAEDEEQIPDYLLLGQILVNQGVLNPAQLEKYLSDYHNECKILDLNFNTEQNNVIQKLLAEINAINADIPIEYISDYLMLLFQNLVRYVESNFTPLSILKMNEISASHCVTQQLECGKFRVASALNMEDVTAISFASRYAGEHFDGLDEYVQASMEDFLNLHNGLYMVNLSNEHALELSLLPPKVQDHKFLSPNTNTFLFPILFPFGLVYFICSVETIN